MERIVDPITMDVMRMTTDKKQSERIDNFKQIHKQNMYFMKIC
ncbi:6-hydroxymethylpterin diphosphokinase MptE-like domain-containing protein OS=Lysinibacillus sphaericus OX=1421 GN=LYSIN_02812 PE=4 SV=1 [Lysinibacillus sphaericus]